MHAVLSRRGGGDGVLRISRVELTYFLLHNGVGKFLQASIQGQEESWEAGSLLRLDFA